MLQHMGSSLVPPPAATEAELQEQQINQLLLLPPVAVNGCFHLLLRLALPAGADAVQAPLAALLAQLRLPVSAGAKHSQHEGGASSSSSSTSGGMCGGVPAVFALQLDGQQPLLVERQHDGTLRLLLAEQRSAAAFAAGVAARTATDAGGIRSCWLPATPAVHASAACRGAAMARALPAAGATDGAGELLLRGVPAAAGLVVRVLLLQAGQVVQDLLVQVEDAAEQEPGRCIRCECMHAHKLAA